MNNVQQLTTPEAWKQLIMLLQKSSRPYTIFFACQNLELLLTKYFNTYKAEDKEMVKQALLQVLKRLSGPLAATQHNHILKSVTGCFAIIQKMCWFESNTKTLILEELAPFLFNTTSIDTIICGIAVMKDLVQTISKTTKGLSPGRQRKIAVSFRDQCLFDIFSLVINKITEFSRNPPQPGSAEYHLLKLTFELAHTVLSFDFIGTAPDEAYDHMGIVHVPASWMSLVSSTSTLELFTTWYLNSAPPVSTVVLSVIALIAGVRNSAIKKEHIGNFLKTLMDSMMKIVDRIHENDIHEFGRLLVRFKSNYQLKQLLESSNYSDFIHKVIRTYNLNTIHYVFMFWARIVSAYTHGRIDDKTTPSHIKEISTRLTINFLSAQLEYCQNHSGLEDEDPLNNELLSTCNYLVTSQELFSILLKVSNYYGPYINNNAAPDQKLAAIERMLAWVLFVLSAVISGKKITRSLQKDEEEASDAQLIVHTFQSMQVHGERFNKTGPTNSTHLLELAYCYFLQRFCRLYLNEKIMQKSQVYTMLAEKLNIKPAAQIIELIVTKIMQLLQYWTGNERIRASILGPQGLFFSLAGGFSSSKLMGKSDVVNNLLTSHQKLEIGGDPSNRVSFYKTLGRLFFADKTRLDFFSFVAPFNTKLNTLRQASSGLQPNQIEGFREAFNTVFSDLRGIVMSCYNTKSYLVFFNWFYVDTGYYEWILNLVSQNPNLMSDDEFWCVLKFVNEFTQNNKNKRIEFPSNSADGIRLFKSTVNFLVSQSNRLNSNDEDARFKSLKLYLRCCHNILNGKYVNFGIFELYNDNTLSSFLTTLCQVLGSVSTGDMSKYSKVEELIFKVLHVLSMYHIDFIATYPGGNIFTHFLYFIKYGLQAKRGQCSEYLFNIFSRHFENIQANKQNRMTDKRRRELEIIAKQIQQNQNLINSFFLDMIDLLVTFNNVHYLISNSLLVMLLIFSDGAKVVQQILTSSQSDQAKITTINTLFANLSNGVTEDLTSDNKETFSQNLAVFRGQLANTVDASGMLKAFINAHQQLNIPVNV